MIVGKTDCHGAAHQAIDGAGEKRSRRKLVDPELRDGFGSSRGEGSAAKAPQRIQTNHDVNTKHLPSSIRSGSNAGRHSNLKLCNQCMPTTWKNSSTRNIGAAGIGRDWKVPLFRVASRKTNELTYGPMPRVEVWRMIRQPRNALSPAFMQAGCVCATATWR